MEQRPRLTGQDFIRSLLRPERVQENDPFRIITLLPIDPYEHVADIGCGPGFFSIPLAKYLVHGKLYALDTWDEALNELRRRVSEASLGNVDVLECGPLDFPMPDASVEGVFLAYVLHDTEDRVAFLSAVRRLLKPGGWFAILNWYRKETEHGPPLEKRIEPDELESLSRDAGFRWRWWRDLNGIQYMAMLRK